MRASRDTREQSSPAGRVCIMRACSPTLQRHNTIPRHASKARREPKADTSHAALIASFDIAIAIATRLLQLGQGRQGRQRLRHSNQHGYNITYIIFVVIHMYALACERCSLCNGMVKLTEFPKRACSRCINVRSASVEQNTTTLETYMLVLFWKT